MTQIQTYKAHTVVVYEALSNTTLLVRKGHTVIIRPYVAPVVRVINSM